MNLRRFINAKNGLKLEFFDLFPQFFTKPPMLRFAIKVKV